MYSMTFWLVLVWFFSCLNLGIYQWWSLKKRAALFWSRCEHVEKLFTYYQSTFCGAKIIKHSISSSAGNIWMNAVCVLHYLRYLDNYLHKNQSPNLHLVFGSWPSSCQIVFPLFSSTHSLSILLLLFFCTPFLFFLQSIMSEAGIWLVAWGWM